MLGASRWRGQPPFARRHSKEVDSCQRNLRFENPRRRIHSKFWGKIIYLGEYEESLPRIDANQREFLQRLLAGYLIQV